MSKKSTHVNVKVQPKKDEPFERMLKRFLKKVKKERVIEQVRERRYYEKPSITRRKAKLEGIKKEKKRVREFEKKINFQNDNTYNKKRG
jgi:small subunit ribosomal protein S21